MIVKRINQKICVSADCEKLAEFSVDGVLYCGTCVKKFLEKKSTVKNSAETDGPQSPIFLENKGPALKSFSDFGKKSRKVESRIKTDPVARFEAGLAWESGLKQAVKFPGDSYIYEQRILGDRVFVYTKAGTPIFEILPFGRKIFF